MRDYDKMANLIANIKYDLDRLDNNENITVREHDDQLEYLEEEYETLKENYAALKDDVADLIISLCLNDKRGIKQHARIIQSAYFSKDEMREIIKEVDRYKKGKV